MSRRPLSPLMEVREANPRERPWSIGSELLGHYESNPSGGREGLSPGQQYTSFSPSSGVIDIHDGTFQATNGHFDDRMGISQRDLVNGEARGDSMRGQLSSDRRRDGAYEVGGGPNQINMMGGSGEASQSQGAMRQEGPLEGGPPQLIRASTTMFERAITDWWWWELLSWLISFFSFGAIVVELLLSSNKPPPTDWKLGLTLNAYISILAALSKAALILPVSEAIGQLKWIWFRQNRKLVDFFTFDASSRGPWGSLVLLCSAKCRHLVALGATITILSLAFEPFFQQIVSYPTRPIVTGNGTVAIATSYHVPPNEFGHSDLAMDPIMDSAVQAAAIGNNDTSRPPPSTCPSGNCTWTQYSSLGVCTQCQQLQNTLQFICKNYTALNMTFGGGTTRFGCGYTLNNTLMAGTWIDGVQRTFAIVLSALAVNSTQILNGHGGPQVYSTLFRDVAYPLLDIYIAYTPGGRDAVIRKEPPVLLECLFSWCAKTYNSSHTQGLLNETTVSNITNDTSRGLSASEIASGLQPVVINIPEEKRAFTVSNGTTEALRTRLIEFLGVTMVDQEEGSPPRTSPPQTLSSFGGFFQSPPYDVNPFLESIATAISHVMRSKTNGTDYVRGPAFDSETFVRIRWAWISLPSVMLLGSFIFLSATIIKSSRHKAHAWKTSALFMLLHGLTGEVRQRLDPESTPSEIEAAARKLEVVLCPEKENTRLVLA